MSKNKKIHLFLVVMCGINVVMRLPGAVIDGGMYDWAVVGCWAGCCVLWLAVLSTLNEEPG